jgi:magnesium chelatase family protein
MQGLGLLILNRTRLRSLRSESIMGTSGWSMMVTARQQSRTMRQFFAHSMLMGGPPGAGKTLLARAVPAILPRMTFDESLVVTKIYSISGQLPPDTALIRHRPFRAPHHTISFAGLVGGGKVPGPGEISLAHRGVLFGTRLLEMLRQPLEDRQLTIARSAGSLTLPVSFMLIGAMPPCPCGWYGEPVQECTGSISAVLPSTALVESLEPDGQHLA